MIFYVLVDFVLLIHHKELEMELSRRILLHAYLGRVEHVPSMLLSRLILLIFIQHQSLFILFLKFNERSKKEILELNGLPTLLQQGPA